MRTCKGHRRSPTRRRSRQRVPIDRTPTPWSAANVRCADRDKANRTSRHLQSQRFMNRDWRGFLLSSWFHPLICFPLLICSEWSTCGPQTPLKATKQDINYESSDWPLSYVLYQTAVAYRPRRMSACCFYGSRRRIGGADLVSQVPKAQRLAMGVVWLLNYAMRSQSNWLDPLLHHGSSLDKTVHLFVCTIIDYTVSSWWISNTGLLQTLGVIHAVFLAELNKYTALQTLPNELKNA